MTTQQTNLSKSPYTTGFFDWQKIRFTSVCHECTALAARILAESPTCYDSGRQRGYLSSTLSRTTRRRGRLRIRWASASKKIARLAAWWQDAQDGRGSLRLAYTFAVLLIWLEQHQITA